VGLNSKEIVMNIQTCKFVHVSELLGGADFILDYLENVDFTWGNNSRSLISVEKFVNALNECVLTELDEVANKEQIALVNAILKTCETLMEEDVYIDMEN
jgi:hypothetical protein